MEEISNTPTNEMNPRLFAKFLITALMPVYAEDRPELWDRLTQIIEDRDNFIK